MCLSLYQNISIFKFHMEYEITNSANISFLEKNKQKRAAPSREARKKGEIEQIMHKERFLPRFTLN